MKLLFLCSTEFQLMTAFNIKCHMHPNDDADIIVNNYHGDEKSLAERIRTTKIFSNVFYVQSNIENETLHKYSKTIISGEEGPSLFSAVNNSIIFVTIKLLTKVCGATAYINHMVANSNNLTLATYDIFFAYIHGKRPILNYLLNYFLHHNTRCKINLLDEGVGTYAFSEGKPYMKIIDKYYVYDPDMMIFNKCKCVKIPSMDKKERSFIELLNYVFQFHASEMEDYRNSIIYFDIGVANKIPPYLRSNNLIVNHLLHKTRLYKRHLKEEQVFHEQINLVNIILEKTDSQKIWIKMHPRQSKDSINEYKERTIKLIKRYDLPWELIALNCPLGNNILITNYSSSVCLYNSVIKGIPDDIDCVLIYKLTNKPFSWDLERYFEELARKYHNFYIPKTTDDLINIQKRFIN